MLPRLNDDLADYHAANHRLRCTAWVRVGSIIFAVVCLLAAYAIAVTARGQGVVLTYPSNLKMDTGATIPSGALSATIARGQGGGGVTLGTPWTTIPSGTSSVTETLSAKLTSTVPFTVNNVMIGGGGDGHRSEPVYTTSATGAVSWSDVILPPGGTYSAVQCAAPTSYVMITPNSTSYVNSTPYVKDYPTTSKPKDPTVMEILGGLFIVAILIGGVLAVVTFVGHTFDSLKALKRRLDHRDSAEARVARLEKLKVILGPQSTKAGEITAIFEE